MVNPDNQVYLKHIKDSCHKCLKFVSGMDYEKFIEDDKTISAVARELSVIGEAARKVSEDYKRKYPLIPWDKIIGMRNRLIHAYMEVELSIIWQTLQEDIPHLNQLLDDLLH